MSYIIIYHQWTEYLYSQCHCLECAPYMLNIFAHLVTFLKENWIWEFGGRLKIVMCTKKSTKCKGNIIIFGYPTLVFKLHRIWLIEIVIMPTLPYMKQLGKHECITGAGRIPLHYILFQTILFISFLSHYNSPGVITRTVAFASNALFIRHNIQFKHFIMNWGRTPVLPLTFVIVCRLFVDMFGEFQAHRFTAMVYGIEQIVLHFVWMPMRLFAIPQYGVIIYSNQNICFRC